MALAIAAELGAEASDMHTIKLCASTSGYRDLAKPTIAVIADCIIA